MCQIELGMSPRARPRCHKAGEGQGQQPGKASSQGFIQHSMSVQRLLGDDENHREGGNTSPEPHVPALLQGMGDRGIPSLSVVAQTDIPGPAAGASAPCSCFWQIPSAWPSHQCQIPPAWALLLKGKQGKISSVLCPGAIPVSQGVATHTSGPVINVPVITGLVDEAVVAVQLLLTHVRQVLLGKEAEEGWIRMSGR